jgi:hypothetical protein
MIQKLFLFLSMALVAKMGFSQDLSKIPEYTKNYDFSRDKSMKDSLDSQVKRKMSSLSKLSDDEKSKKIISMIEERQKESLERYEQAQQFYGAIEKICNGMMADRGQKPIDIKPVPQISQIPTELLQGQSLDNLVKHFSKTEFDNGNILYHWGSLSFQYSDCVESIRNVCPDRSVNEDFEKLNEFIKTEKPDEKPNTSTGSQQE